MSGTQHTWKAIGAEAPSAAPQLLSSIDQIDARWLKAAIDTRRVDLLPEIARIHLEAIGAGTSSDTRRILIEYVRPGKNAPVSVVCKFQSQSPRSHQGAIAAGVYLREAGAMDLLTGRSACNIPHIFHAAATPEAINLVMEDLTASAVPGDQIKGCSIDEAGAVIDELARLHSVLTNAETAQAPDWLMRMPDAANSMGTAVRAGAANARARFGDALSERQYTTISECAEIVEDWLQLTPKNIAFTHGDPRVDNILFDIRNGSPRATLIDWQLAGLRDPFYDIAYFLVSSLTTKDRTRSEKDLVLRYISKSKMNWGSETAIFTAYRLAIIASFTLTIVSIAALAETPRLDRLILSLLERNIAATEEWSGLTAIRNAVQLQKKGHV